MNSKRCWQKRRMSEEYIPKFHKRFWRDLDKLEPKVAERVLDAIESKLLVDPYR